MAFLQQQWLGKRAPLLRYTYTAYLVFSELLNQTETGIHAASY